MTHFIKLSDGMSVDRGFLSPQIEKFFPHILEKEKTRREEEPSILSPEEFVFAKE